MKVSLVSVLGGVIATMGYTFLALVLLAVPVAAAMALVMGEPLDFVANLAPLLLGTAAIVVGLWLAEVSLVRVLGGVIAALGFVFLALVFLALPVAVVMAVVMGEHLDFGVADLAQALAEALAQLLLATGAIVFGLWLAEISSLRALVSDLFASRGRFWRVFSVVGLAACLGVVGSLLLAWFFALLKAGEGVFRVVWLAGLISYFLVLLLVFVALTAAVVCRLRRFFQKVSQG